MHLSVLVGDCTFLTYPEVFPNELRGLPGQQLLGDV